MMSVSHEGKSSEEPEAALEKKSETESKTFPIAASIFLTQLEDLFFEFLYALSACAIFLRRDQRRKIIDRGKSFALII